MQTETPSETGEMPDPNTPGVPPLDDPTLPDDEDDEDEETPVATEE